MVDQKALERIVERIADHNKKRHGKLRLSVEYGRGETYRGQDVTVYSLDNYERSSVLYGRERRMWVCSFGIGEDAEQNARDTIKAAAASGFTDFSLGCSSYIPVDEIVRHIPDDTDY